MCELAILLTLGLAAADLRVGSPRAGKLPLRDLLLLIVVVLLSSAYSSKKACSKTPKAVISDREGLFQRILAHGVVRPDVQATTKGW